MSAVGAHLDERHILVVDDDRRIRTLLERFLRDRGYRVSAAADAAEARTLMKALAFDLIVLDVMMPGEDGFSLTGAIRAGATGAARDVPVLLLTARGEVEDRIEGLSHGADDYLAKPFEPRELLLRLGAILRRTEAAGPARGERVALGPMAFEPGSGRLMREDEEIHLTDGERALLAALASRPGAVFSRAALIERMGADARDDRAVDVQVTRLRRKIETDPRRPRYLKTQRGEGYVLVPD
ncbi:MAG: response regulator [Alphaproteobacteria bacterium]|nr:response regulator [Alphaproteobacteria bacterium]MDX5369382.1 response regulator [Alphaproteobacteria bacterium]MDX5464063.1 response regulator [Alphaproteobacteria bacterium]